MITVTGFIHLYFSLNLSISHDYRYRICTYIIFPWNFSSLTITVTGSVLLCIFPPISHDYRYRICTSILSFGSLHLSWLPLPDLYFYAFPWIFPSLMITVTGSVLLNIFPPISQDYRYRICTSILFLGSLPVAFSNQPLILIIPICTSQHINRFCKRFSRYHDAACYIHFFSL